MEQDIAIQSIGLINIESIIGVTKTKATSERADLISQFVDEINKTSNKVATFKQINGQLRFYNTHALYILLRQCKEASCFGAFFWWKIKQNRQYGKSEITS